MRRFFVIQENLERARWRRRCIKECATAVAQVTGALLNATRLWGTPVQSFVFLRLLVFELEPIVRVVVVSNNLLVTLVTLVTQHRARANVRDIRQTDRQTDDGRRSSLNAPAPPTGRAHNNVQRTVTPGACRVHTSTVCVRSIIHASTRGVIGGRLL